MITKILFPSYLWNQWEIYGLPVSYCERTMRVYGSSGARAPDTTKVVVWLASDVATRRTVLTYLSKSPGFGAYKPAIQYTASMLSTRCRSLHHDRNIIHTCVNFRVFAPKASKHSRTCDWIWHFDICCSIHETFKSRTALRRWFLKVDFRLVVFWK